MKLAWCSAQSTEIGVADRWDALHEVTGEDPSVVVWWMADGHEPTVEEAHARRGFLRDHGVSPYAFTPVERQPRLTIERVWLDNPDVQLLISNLNSDLYSRYPEPGALIFSLDSADIVDGVGTLLMAELDGEPVGCGAFRVMDEWPGSAEIKRMYVTLAGRGRKIGYALLAELELAAGAIDVRRFVLETGPRQPEALALYERAGYRRVPCFGSYAGVEDSLCYERSLPGSG